MAGLLHAGWSAQYPARCGHYQSPPDTSQKEKKKKYQPGGERGEILWFIVVVRCAASLACARSAEERKVNLLSLSLSVRRNVCIFSSPAASHFTVSNEQSDRGEMLAGETSLAQQIS